VKESEAAARGGGGREVHVKFTRSQLDSPQRQRSRALTFHYTFTFTFTRRGALWTHPFPSSRQTWEGVVYTDGKRDEIVVGTGDLHQSEVCLCPWIQS
jgi:hypothetical protein